MKTTQVFNAVLDVKSKKIGIAHNNGGIITTVKEENGNKSVTVAFSKLCKPITLVATEVALSKVQPGDLLVEGNRFIGIIMKSSKSNYTYLRLDGTKVEVSPIVAEGDDEQAIICVSPSSDNMTETILVSQLLQKGTDISNIEKYYEAKKEGVPTNEAVAFLIDENSKIDALSLLVEKSGSAEVEALQKVLQNR